MTELIHATINGLPVEVAQGTTILDAARQVHVRIPTLCKHPDLDATAACGICIVQIKNNGKMLRACCTPIEDKMDILTETPEIVEVRRSVLELTLSRHPNECLTCLRNQNCELQTLAADFGLTATGWTTSFPTCPSTTRRTASCLIRASASPAAAASRFASRIRTSGRSASSIAASIRASPPRATFRWPTRPACVAASARRIARRAPSPSTTSRSEVWDKLQDPNAYCVAQIAPAVRVAIGEAFGFPIGANLTGKIYAALRRMGFKAVFDTNFGADLTIMEEATEFKARLLEGKGELPLITSCCPGWVDFMEKFHGDMIQHFSSCKSPHAMVGALAKTYYAEKQKIDPAKIYMVSIMPCTAKKSEIIRSKEMRSSGYQDVDVSITTREFARMIKQSGIDFVTIPEEQPDQHSRRVHRRGNHLRRDRRRDGSGTAHGRTTM